MDQISPMLPFHLHQFYCICSYVSFNNVWTTISTFIQSVHLNRRSTNTEMHMRDATECINSIRYGLFAAIKAIFSNWGNLELILKYIQTTESINKFKNRKRRTRYGDRGSKSQPQWHCTSDSSTILRYLVMCIYVIYIFQWLQTSYARPCMLHTSSIRTCIKSLRFFSRCLCDWQQAFLNESAEGRRMTVEIISRSISTKVWDRAGIDLATPGSAVTSPSALLRLRLIDC